MYGYPAVLERDTEGNVLVSFPDFPEAHTYGDDVEQALTRARDALATIVDAYIRDRQSIPEPSRATLGTYLIRLPALTKAKVDLYNAMREARVSKTDLARRLGWHLPQVDRLLDIHHASRLDQLESAFTALGKELFVASLDRQTSRQLRVGAGRFGAGGGAARSRAAGQKPATEADRRISRHPMSARKTSRTRIARAKRR